MYLSHLLVDVGDNPDRPRPARLWLRDIYRVHQRLSMAFPTSEQRARDPQFLRPFDPTGFEPRHSRTHFLFRIDSGIEDDSRCAIILVQSDLRPDWDYAFHNARMFLAAQPETREYTPTFEADEQVRFRICANLSKKSPEHRSPTDRTDAQGRRRTQGKRVALTWDGSQRPDAAIRTWFEAKTASGGFQLQDFRLVRLGWVGGYRSSDKSRLRLRSALLEGTLRVTDAQAFAETLASGIGSAKAFGFGLLSVAPLP